MSPTRKRKWLAGLLIVGSATVFQYLPTGCGNYFVSQALTAFDFCAVFNCTGGSFVDMCNPVALLTDCPTTGDQSQ